MPRPLSAQRVISFIFLITAYFRAVWADDSSTPQTGPPMLHIEPNSFPLTPGPDSNDSPEVFMSSDQLSEQQNVSIELTGNARLSTGGNIFQADNILYLTGKNQVTLEGHVTLREGDQLTLIGPKGFFDLNTKAGWLLEPHFYIQVPTNPRLPFMRGSASKIDIIPPNQQKFTKAQFTSCQIGRNDWRLQSDELLLNQSTQTGESKNTTIYYLNEPILWAPWFSFPLSDQRKSGFLAPVTGTTTTTGFDNAFPYYFNIAPNVDDTFTTRVMSLRGIMGTNELRYLEPTFSGTLYTEYLPHDIQLGTDRWFFSLQHQETLLPGLTFKTNIQSASDPNYVADLSSLLGPTGLVYLPREFDLMYNVPNWNATLRSLSYQPLFGVAPISRIAPELDVNWDQNKINQINFSAQTQYMSIVSPGPTATVGNITVNNIQYNSNYQSLNSGTRSYFYPQMTIPWVTPDGYVKFKTGLSMTQYQMGEFNTSPNNQYNRNLPISSLDAGLFFDRSVNIFNRDMTQTLEPRLYYVYIPYVNQNNLPIYDTGLADFNQSSIFTDNRFSGIDRINNANQVTTGVTTRFVDHNSGSELLNLFLGQRYYFTPNMVLLPGQFNTQPNASDMLIGATSRVTNSWTLDSYFNFNTHGLQTQQMMASANYSPAPSKLFNLSYRIDTPVPGVPTNLITAAAITSYIPGFSPPINFYTAVKQWDVSSEWPISSRWNFLNRVSYSTLDSRILEGLLGLEYNTDCWSLRFVSTRFAMTSVQTDSAFFIQLELGPLGVGQNPFQALKRNIPGYQSPNEISP